MRKSILSRSIAVCTAALAVSGMAAGAASAVPATFSPTGSATPTESAALTIKIGTTPTPARTITCSPASIYQQSAGTANMGVPAVGTLSLAIKGVCVNASGGTALVDFSASIARMWAQKVGSVFSLNSVETFQATISSGSGFYISNASQVVPSYTVGWTNGTSVANPSTANFTNTPIGKVTNADSGIVGQPITLSGTIKLSSGGGLLTLS